MTDHTYLPGKDVPLEETIAKATTLLHHIGLDTEEASWLNPAPNCWSVHLQASACHHLCTNGKGTSRLAALASGLGEFFERLATNFFFTDYFLDDGDEHQDFLFYPEEKWFPVPVGPDNTIPISDGQGTELLNTELRSFYDPDGELTFEHLCDNNSDSTDRGICALPFQSLADRSTTYFPVSLLNNLYVSNGMAAGNSPAECCSQALSEIIERYVKSRIIAQGISLPDVPQSFLKKYPRLSAIIDTLAEQGLSVQVKDGSLGGHFPVIAALLTDSVSGGAFAAFGANCRFETAIERTLTEMLQGRSLDRLRDFPPPSHDRAQVADAYNLESHFIDSTGLLLWDMFKSSSEFDFSPWDFTGPTEQEFDRLQGLIADQGFHLYRAEYLHCGMYSCRMIVPGMSEIYPVDDLVWNNRGTGALLRPHLLRLPAMKSRQLRQLLDLLDTLDLSDQLLVSQTIGILFNDNSPWATLRIGELKAMLFLALKDKEHAILWCGWSAQYGELPEDRKRLYRLLQTLLHFDLAGDDPADYQKGLRLFYSEEELRAAEAVCCGTSRFPGLNFGASWTQVSAEHEKLLKIYRRVNSLKEIQSR